MEDSGTSKDTTPTHVKGKKRGRVVSILFVILLIMAALLWGGYQLFGRLNYVYEYDARVGGTLIIVSSRVSGWVTERAVEQGSEIKKGQLLVQIDSRESTLKVQHYDVKLQGVKAEIDRLAAERSMVERQTNSRHDTQESEYQAAEAATQALKAQRKLAMADFERSQSLLERKIIPRQSYDKANAELQRLEGEVAEALAKQKAASAKLEEVEADRERLKVLDQQLSILLSQKNEYFILKDQQRLDLKDRTIQSIIDGVVDETFVEKGEYVNPGQRLMLIHDPLDIWVDANIKETQIRRVKRGQVVLISVDAYPDKEFKGTVKAIGNTTTGKFALLPNPNPSGNFTKITQRIPVRIAVEQQKIMLRPGMLVEVKIMVDPIALSSFFR
ncbi:MAG: HlyD family secretion protein [Deltaproteobacteria bacterium]|nr:HlyD family secretion protein [Deltaproteobacteria bacterium]